MNPAPREYTAGAYFERARRRFEVMGTRMEEDGTFLCLRCRACGHELNYAWLKKAPNDTWTGQFGNILKARLNSNYSHRKCKFIVNDAMKSENQQLQAENIRLKEQLTTTNAPANLTINNIVIVNLPAVTRIGSTGEPLMCSDIPYPDEKTVLSLLANPESAIPDFVYKRYFMSENPSISAPDSTNTKLKLVQRDERGNHWVDASLDTTVDSIVYKTLDTLDDEFNAMNHNSDFKDWKRREGLTAHIGFDRTDAYQKLQSDVRDVLKTHGVPYDS